MHACLDHTAESRWQRCQLLQVNSSEGMESLLTIIVAEQRSTARSGKTAQESGPSELSLVAFTVATANAPFHTCY